jgi:translation initiation factor IF-3
MSTPRARINHQIKAPELRVITVDGDNLGVLSLQDAIKAAQSRGLDLIEISPAAVPPVAKIMDYGKFLYDEKKKQKVVKAKTQTTEIKSIQIKIATGDHDLERKAKEISDWLSEGNRVKVDLYLSGRAKYMNLDFLKERLDRVMKLVTVEFKTSGEPLKGPKGLTVYLEKK